MNNLKLLLVLWSFLFTTNVSASDACRHDNEKFTDYVNPWIGTGGHGHVFLGANVPFGLIQLGPTEHTRGWDWCSVLYLSRCSM